MAPPNKKKNSPASGTRKKSASGTGKKNRKTKKSAKKSLNQGLLSLLILFSLVLVLALFSHFYLKPDGSSPKPEAKSVVKREVPVKRAESEKPPERTVSVMPLEKTPEVLPKPPEKTPEPPPESTPEPEKTPPIYEAPITDEPVIQREPLVEPPSGKPKIAIIIDDLGYDLSFAGKLMDLGIPITFSILPESPHGIEIAKKAHERGFEVMLHQPMEPEEYPRVKPGPGAIFMKMGPDETIAVLKKNLKSIPHVRGVNNHMGSRLTRSEQHLNQIFSVLKQEKLFFIDSLTSPKSLGRSSARLFRLPFARRDVFLDHVQTGDFVEKQMDALVRLSRKYGSAIGIGHPHGITLKVLRQQIPKAKKKVKFVFASDLVTVIKE